MHPGYTNIVLGMGSQMFHPSRSRMLLKRKRSMIMHLCHHCLGIGSQTFHPNNLQKEMHPCYAAIVWALEVIRVIPVSHVCCNKRKLNITMHPRIHVCCFIFQ